ncbi:sulfate adenylyltransferase [Pontibacter sp. BAB1700]|nr:sulfate adenylyltransferase [Pontibacter sp. BAB1700]
MILVDARNGVVEQTFRHFYISCLLRIPNVVVCVNKMDLVDYDQTKFEEIKAAFMAFAEKVRFPGQEISFIPVSSLYGENLVRQSAHMPGTKGYHYLVCWRPCLWNSTCQRKQAVSRYSM